MTPNYPDEALYTLLCKYLLDEADTEERAWVDTWLQDDAGNAALLGSLGKVLDTAATHAVVVETDTNQSWERLYNKMNIPAGAPTPVAHVPELTAVRSSARYTLLKIAAVVLVVLGAGLWFLNTRSAIEKYAGPMTAKLQDGSSIELMESSTLEVAKGYNSSHRNVSLQGAATFDVAGNASQPFVVMLGHTEVKVLGTRFLVRYNPGEAGLTVHVTSGKVMVINHDKADSVILTEGMLLQQDSKRPAFRVTSHVADIAKRSLSFHDTPLEEVLHTITEVYDVKVEVENISLLKLTVNTNFGGENIEEVINALAMTLNAKWEKTGDRHYILK
ncbi:MAG TPA: FecR domain-containing protein [Chitinophaga sp.]|uniref:FecR family protein n=1 Tax=Chitinophaga sp. TaxID=1869181 RepID=UPI002BAEBD1E|nr:FecR domain-containing protein [Chitinophaga sp.]HVI49399.1 FecR domain-containing protein [Chitinophaga sp.]